MVLAAHIIASTIIVGQCPIYSVLWMGGQNCGVFGPAGAAARGMSSSGHILCGRASTCQGDIFAFSWEPGQVLVPVPFGFVTGTVEAYDVNSTRMIVGTVFGTAYIGFVSRDGETALLGALKGDVISEAHAINESGVIVGMSSGDLQRAVYWQNDTPTALLLPDGPSSLAQDINDANQICGWMGDSPSPLFGASPFIWHNGKTTTLPLPNYAAANTGTATAINNRGDACGYFFVTHPQKQFVQRACAWIDGQFIDLGVLPGTDGSIARDISDAREIVGYCTGPTGGFAGGFLWRDGVIHALLDIAPTGTFSQVSPHAINALGQIAGGASLLPDNDGVAFRLTPALPATPGDTDCSGSVDIDDLLNVIGHWNPAGPVGGRPADLNRDNRIDIHDIVQVIANWTGPI
jgi:uncharacterized membrane protein